MKFLVDLSLDGYKDEEEMKKACVEFIQESLDFSASSVSVEVYNNTAQHAAPAGMRCQICGDPIISYCSGCGAHDEPPCA